MMDNPGGVIARLEDIEHDLALRQNIRHEDRGYSTPCWVWTRSRTAQGYGDAWFGGRHLLLHRWVYEQVHGALPESPLEIDHLCRVRLCCNPAHLEAVTHHTNMRRGARSKLTLEQIDDILRSPLRECDLARKYGVRKQTIAYYRNGEYQRRLERAA